MSVFEYELKMSTSTSMELFRNKKKSRFNNFSMNLPANINVIGKFDLIAQTDFCN